MLSVVFLSVEMRPIILIVVMLSINLMSIETKPIIVMLNVVVLIVVAPLEQSQNFKKF